MHDAELAKTLANSGLIESIAKLSPGAQVTIIIVIGVVVCVGLICAAWATVRFWANR